MHHLWQSLPVELQDEIVSYTDLQTAFTVQNERESRKFAREDPCKAWLNAVLERNLALIDWLIIHFAEGYNPRVLEKACHVDNDIAKYIITWLIATNQHETCIPDTVLMWVCMIGNDVMVNFLLDKLDDDHFDLEYAKLCAVGSVTYPLIVNEIERQRAIRTSIRFCQECFIEQSGKLKLCSVHNFNRRS